MPESIETKWFEASDDLIQLARELIDKYHAHLRNVRIGFIMRKEAPISNGHITLGKCTKVSPQNKTLMPYDFVIWIALDKYKEMSEFQRRAMIDHELCHAEYDLI